MNTSDSILIDPTVLVDARGYGRDGYPWDAWKTLRNNSPVHWCAPTNARPFWALTRQAEIRHVSTHPETFENAPRPMIMSHDVEAVAGGPSAASMMRTLINMDPPEHRDYRAIAASFLKPTAVRGLEATARAVVHELLDGAGASSEPFDFVSEIAMHHPLRVICRILGAAPEDEPLVLRIANTAFGIEDPEYFPQMAALGLEMMEYYRRIQDDRRALPRPDLYSALANARVGGKPMGAFELVGYFLIMTTAGHDTTRNALAGGLHALVEHPEQLDRLRDDPSLCTTAADEIIRWTSPVIQFCRTPNLDVEIGGQRIRGGESLAMFYPSANRDETVFDDPDRFDVGRDPNPHLAFGVGEHFCLGTHLARLEIRVLLEELVPRLEHVELAGPVERTAASFVGGIKHLPIRWKLRDTLPMSS